VVFLAAALGLLLSFGLEGMILPVPQPWWRRSPGSSCLHAGAWLAVYCLLALLLGRPWFSMTIELALLLLIVLVNNAKMKSLREPFVFADFEYFTDAIKHPRLYIPFLGWGNAIAATCGFCLAAWVGWLLESAPAGRFAWAGQLGAIATLALLAVVLLAVGIRTCPELTLDPIRDLRELGLTSSLWRQGLAERVVPAFESPFASLPVIPGDRAKPNLIAVQNESFFDPRPLFDGIRQDVLAEFDRVKASAIEHGLLDVPAWGANTVRTEFAFLSGISQSALGVHRFNPYRRAARAGIATLASFLKSHGYRTICLHPYPSSFYARDRVYPLLGFDEFIDIRGFSGAERCGPYVADRAVADRIAEVLGAASGPTFIFAITMENHGPLHLERITERDAFDLYSHPPPRGCEDLTIYLRHLRNADRMLGNLRAVLASSASPGGLCWFGDHVPIMTDVYSTLGSANGATSYLLWRSDARECRMAETRLGADQLALAWLRAMGMIDPAKFEPAARGTNDRIACDRPFS
jgi:hypothetical protein